MKPVRITGEVDVAMLARSVRTILAAALALPALTEAAESPAGPPSTLEEVVVTAQRRTENLQQTPLAVTALSGVQLEQRNIRTTLDLMQVTPGLQVSTQTAADAGGSATFFLRGMGQQQAGNGSEPAVGVYVDDIYYPTLQGAVFQLLDVEQVEVLRGPQGTLFGRNTIGGALRYTTRKPTDTLEGFAQVEGGNLGRRDYTGMLNLPLGERAAVRLSGGHLESDGYVRQQDGGPAAGASDATLGRVQLRLRPTEHVTIDLSGQYARTKLDGFAYTQPGPIDALPGTLPGIWNSIPPLGGSAPYDDRYRSVCVYCQAGTSSREFSTNTTKSGTSVVEWRATDTLTLKSLTGWTEVDSTSFSDLDGTPLPIYQAPGGNHARAWSQELQINGRSARADWVGGLYYYDAAVRTGGKGEATVLAGPVPLGGQETKTKTYAAFLDATVPITDRLSALGGVRYSRDDKRLALYAASGAQTDEASDTFASTTGRAGLRMQWTPDLMGYATVSLGFRAGGFTYTGVGYDRFDPERATSVELGVRSDLAERRVRVNPTIFYTRWRDIQVQIAKPTDQGVFLTLQNAARATSYGAELETEAAVTDRFRLYGSLAYLHLRYDDTGGALGITKDSQFQRAPRFTYALGARYDQPVGAARLSGTLNWSWQDDQKSTAQDSDALRLPSYGLLNARLEFVDPSGRWTLAVFGTNLTDKSYFVGGANYGANIGTAHYDLGRPREYGASVRYAF
jgi:iron complex outermembrane receptor protein